MYEVKLFQRDKHGNRGALIATARYPTKEQAEKAKKAYIFLCANQKKYKSFWTLKNIIIV